MTWRDMAACRDLDTEVFFPHAAGARGGMTKESKTGALRICAGCGVTTECLTYALTTPGSQDFGIWGGTTRVQRVEMRKARLSLPMSQHQPPPSGRTLQEAAKV